MLRNSRALVTGAGGFVGANLVRRLLAEQAAVHALVRRDTDLWRLADVRERLVLHVAELADWDDVRRVVRDVGPDLVFHLAKHRGNPAALDYGAAYTHNLHATLHLLEAVEGGPVRRFVHAGSSLEYDLERSPLVESDASPPRTVHGITKAAAAMLCQHFARTRGVPAIVLRFFTVYGPWEGPARFVPQLMLAVIDNRPVHVTGGVTLAHDWVFVDDVVDACVRAADADDAVGEIVNIGTGRQTTNAEMVQLVTDAAGRPLPVAAEPFPGRPWDTAQWVADVSKARRVLGWTADTDVRAGLARTLDWFRANAAPYRERMRCD